MALIHKTKKEEGKKHKTKKKTQKKQQIFIIKLRKDRFRMFGPHSKPISAVPAWFKADVGLFRPFRLFRSPADMTPIRLDFGLIVPVRCESARIEVESVRIEPSRSESMKKKKKLKRAGSRTPHRAASDSGAAPSQPRPCIIGYISLQE